MDLRLGNCIEVLKTIPKNSIDSIVTDPPYELGFMGKKWDSSGIAFNTDVWIECLRVLKPGGHLLSFGGSRTYHRMACAIEDAGFEIRDQIQWIYGSGFPKSLNIGKAVDGNIGKLNFGLERLQDALNAERINRGLTLKDVNILLGAPENSGMAAHKMCDKSQPQFITRDQMEILDREWGLKNKYKEIYSEAEREYIGRGRAGLTAGNIANFTGEKEFDLTKGTSEWEGWGTALKPAHEPICVARKPIEGTVAQNVLKYGTGGMNIDGCRIGENGGTSRINGSNAGKERNTLHGGNFGVADINAGRFPANVIHDGSDEVVRLFPDSKTNFIEKQSDCNIDGNTSFHSMRGNRPSRGYDGDGSAARFFYCAKASKSERDEGLEQMNDRARVDYGGFHTEKGLIENNRHPENRMPIKNNHPTVKPVKLMQYLVKLVTRPGGTVLDPFMGSGTTGVACKKDGYDFIGIEMDEKHFEICEARINHAKLDIPEPTNQLSLF